MASGRSSLKFETSLDSGFKSVQKVVPIDIFLAAGIVDGDGKKSNRVVFRAAGDTQFYFMYPKGTEELLKPAAGWLQEQLERETGSILEGIPVDLISEGLLGNPLEE